MAEQDKQQIEQTVAADLAQGLSIPRPSGRMTSDGGMARRKPVTGNSDPLAAAMQYVDELSDACEAVIMQYAQLADRVSKLEQRTSATSIELLHNSVKALQATVGSLVAHVEGLQATADLHEHKWLTLGELYNQLNGRLVKIEEVRSNG